MWSSHSSHSSLDHFQTKWINSTICLPPQPVPTSQVNSHLPCYTPRLPDNKTFTNLLSGYNLYASHSVWSRPTLLQLLYSGKIDRGQVFQRGKQLHLCSQSWGNPFGLLAFLLIGQQGNCWENVCKITNACSVLVTVVVALKWKISLCVNRKEKNTPENHIWKRHAAAKYAWGVSQDSIC